MTSPSLEDLARDIVDALARGRPRRALELAPAALEAAAPLPAFQARVYAWQAQAWLALGEARPATEALRLALRTARAVGDSDGLAALEPLQKRIFALRSARSAQLPLPDTTLGQALQAIEGERWAEARGLVDTAVAEARAQGDTKHVVVGLLARARLPGEAEAALQEAWEVAEAADESTLVTAVAQAARAAGVQLGVHVF